MFGSNKVNRLLKHPGYNLGTIGSVVGIGAGLSGIFGGGGDGTSTGGQAAGLADPFNAYRHQYGNQLNQYMKDPTAFVKASPGYQFNYEQGLDALQRQFAAGGMSASGNALIGAEQYGQNYAMNASKDIFNELAQLSGANWNSGPNAAQGLLAGNNQQYGMQSQAIQGVFGGLQDIWNKVNTWSSTGTNSDTTWV